MVETFLPLMSRPEAFTLIDLLDRWMAWPGDDNKNEEKGKFEQ